MYVLEHINGVEIDLLLVYVNDGSDRLGHQGEEDGHGSSFQLDIDWDSDSIENHSAELEVDDLSGIRFNDSGHHISGVDSNALRLLVLSDNFKFSLKVVGVDDADLFSLLVA